MGFRTQQTQPVIEKSNSIRNVQIWGKTPRSEDRPVVRPMGNSSTGRPAGRPPFSPTNSGNSQVGPRKQVGQPYWQPFEYEHVHLYCRRCGMIGHRIHQCSFPLHLPKIIASEPSSSTLAPSSSAMGCSSSQRVLFAQTDPAAPTPPPFC